MSMARHYLRASGNLFVSWLLFTGGAAAAPQRHPIDAHDAARMSREQPLAAKAFADGEAAFADGNLERSATAFGEAMKQAPESALAARRRCQALLELRRPAEALTSCETAAARGGSAMDLRAMVRALMSTEAPPKPKALSDALLYASRAVETMPDQPWGYAARCDIARRIGDDELLTSCVRDLERVAPNHYETVAARAALPASHRWTRWLGWSSLGLLFLASVARWLVRAAPRIRGRSAVRTGAALLLACVTAAGQVRADVAGEKPQDKYDSVSGKWHVDDRDPVSSVPSQEEASRDPLQFGYFILDLSNRADKAVRDGNHEAATRYFRAIAKAVPDTALPFSKLCQSYVSMNDRDKAVDACRSALGKRGVTLDDFDHFVRLMLAKSEPLSPAEIGEIDSVLDHLKVVDTSGVAAADLDCQLGARLNDERRLAECTAVLVAQAPSDPKTAAFQWVLALRRGKYSEAERFIDSAEREGMGQGRIREMREATLLAEPVWRRALKNKASVAIALLSALTAVVLAVLGRRASARAAG